MKRILAFLLAALMGLSFTACSGVAEPSQESSEPTINAPSQEEDTLDSEQISESENVESNLSTSNILIVYFSRWGNTNYPDDVDATTSASILIDKDTRYGTTEYIANVIAEVGGGDLHRIETVTPYTADFDELRDVNHDEMNKDYLPELKESNLDISGYDTVFLGYPVWATSVPQAVLSFLNEYDLSGKTVIPFCTHDGYGAGSNHQKIAEASHAAVCLDGVLYNTALAEEIKEYFPLTISMVGYGGREYYGGVDFYPENLEGGQRSFENGEITYCEAHHNMAIFYAQTDKPNLSVDVIPIGKVTSNLSVFDNLDSREDIIFSLVQ